MFISVDLSAENLFQALNKHPWQAQVMQTAEKLFKKAVVNWSSNMVPTINQHWSNESLFVDSAGSFCRASAQGLVPV